MVKCFKFIQVSFASLLILIAASSVNAGEMDDFVQAFKEANALRKQSAELGHEWRDTAGLLRDAKKKAESGELEEAHQLVAQANFQAEAAIAQAKRAEVLWMGRVPR